MTKSAKPDLVSHYKPLGIAAVKAAVAIKQRVAEPRPPEHEQRFSLAKLPEGFHWPQDIDAD